jgi:PAS domain-containing protein
MAGLFLLARAFASRMSRRMQRLSRRHEELVQSIDGIVWEADAKTLQFTFVSAQAERLLGFPVGDWEQADFWVAHLHPDDRDLGERLPRELQRARAALRSRISFRRRRRTHALATRPGSGHRRERPADEYCAG